MRGESLLLRSEAVRLERDKEKVSPCDAFVLGRGDKENGSPCDMVPSSVGKGEESRSPCDVSRARGGEEEENSFREAISLD